MSEQTYSDKEQNHDGAAAAQPRARRTDAGPFIGVLLVALGLLFVAQNMGYLTRFNNWWALFLLLPAYGSLLAAWRAYREHGRLATQLVLGPALAGLLFVVLAVTFLFSFNLALFGPVMLIGFGVLLLLGRR